ncbi:tetratricopeptide repeat protein [Candidatus Magnetaquicoccus inordinatus]|uniref:tetratricopeptide repeat protein n=1 Tax=Candidatus Magnetaquicoccus inordinatus TaxID=2496818 RepID=UPI00102C7532|nr:SEL1-like repeat protein [Candidatus Magnetaquicoccus inordinatus]
MMEEVITDLLQLAEQGDQDAQFKLGFLYAKGITVAADLQEARRWFGKAAEQGHNGAQFELQRLTEEGNSQPA